jgi:hypothetical protein
VARVAKRGKKAILARKGYRGRKEKEVTPEARVSLVLKAREASLVARAYPVLKGHRDLQGQRAIPADLTRL